MKKFFVGVFATFLLVTLPATDSVLERFDSLPVQGEIGEGGALEDSTGLEKGALRANGLNKSLQYFYSYKQSVKPGEKYAFSFNYRTTAKMPNGAFLALVVFDPLRGVKPPPSSLYFKLYSSKDWRHRQFEFTVPEGTNQARVLFRLAGAPESESVWIDHFRLASVVDGTAKGVDLTNFETAFDDWKFDRHLVFEHFMIKNGKVVIDWRNAKVGEAFFEAYGNNEKMQYALYIDNIRVKPKHEYVFEAWFQATDSFAYAANGILIFFYKDADNKAIGQSRYHIRPTKGEWKELIHSFSTPENCAFVDIGLNMRNQPASSIVRFDHIRFKQGEDKLYTRYEIDPDTQKMTVINALSGSLKAENIKEAVIAIQNDAGDKIGSFPCKIGEAASIDIAPFKDGMYILESEITFKDGTTIKGEAKKFGVFNKPNWLNDLGIQRPESPAPTPWRDLKLKDGAVTTWNNVIKFDDKLQLQQISMQNGKKIMSKPLSFEINKKSIFTNASSVKWQAHPSLVSGTCSVQGENWNGELKLSVDYSGFIRYTLKITAQESVVLNSGRLSASLGSVDFINRNDGTWSNIGAVDLNVQNTYATKHLYNDLMFGNLNEGILFFIPKIYPATTSDFDNNCIVATKDGKLELNFIQAELKLASGESHTFDFATAPYPVRPAEINWQKLRFRAGKNSNFDLVWQTSPMMKYCGSLMEQSDDNASAEYLERATKYQMVYQIPTYILESIPQWSYFAKKWRGQPARAYDMGVFGPLPKGDFRERTWADLYIKTMVESLKKVPWPGVYYDCFGGDIFASNGEKYMPIFELRDFHERVYNAQRLNNPNSLTMSHCNMVGTLMTFSNVFLTGEQHRGKFLTHKYYQDFMTLDCFRYETATNIGPDGMLLPQYRHKENVEDPALTAHVMGMATLHNLMIYPNFIVKKTELAIRELQYKLGMDDAEFYGYWLPNPDGMSTNNPEVKLSYWKTPRGCLVTVFNNKKEVVEFEFSTNYPHKTAEFFEPVSGKVTKLEKATRLKLEPYRPGYITLKP
ncbi:MAG: DUF6067 family protein [Victivallaceae bacterium]|nr:DUF6067 family protein [Victivallaceae bacterium]MDD3704343.1 DUF6067 family protein [Victivallaceae bacterium]MDD4317322.1 DUF6067 family protein [Victivallaceae bacterium]MDD5664337.1 DUF6067 family protein [Victivallaceae bacterium]